MEGTVATVSGPGSASATRSSSGRSRTASDARYTGSGRSRYHGGVQLIDDEALVLDSIAYRDRDRIVVFLARREGPLRAVLRGATGGKAPRAAATQVLSRVLLKARLRPGAELATCTSVDLLESSFPLAASLRAASAAAVVAELLLTFCPPGEDAERPFRLGASTLEALLGGVDPDVVVSYVTSWVLRLSGLMAEAGESGDVELEMPLQARPFLEVCRRQPLAEVRGPVPPMVQRWLDRRAREEAERPLRALTFYRSVASEVG